MPAAKFPRVFPLGALAALAALVALPLSAQTAQTAQTARDVGKVSFANSGAPAAQADFLYGLAQLHNFEYDDAAVAFRRAQEIDPGFAMAFWGEAMTHNHAIWMEQDREAARAVLARLAPTPEARRAKALTEREKGYLDALEILYGQGEGEGEKEARDFRYAEALGGLHRRFPDDPDAAAFYALSLLGTAHAGRDIPTYIRSAAVLEEAWPSHPEHPGLVHYLIHSYDDPVHAPLGLRAARLYARLAPKAGHAQHMTSHIFLALGMWNDTVSANEAAMAAMNHGREAKGMHHRACGHYAFWLEYGYLQQGRFAQAKKALEACRGEVAHGEVPMRCGADPLDPDATSRGSLVAMQARYLLDTGDWTGEVAGWQIDLGTLEGPQLTQRYLEGRTALTKGDLAAAKGALDRLREARQALIAQLDREGRKDPSYKVRGEILEQQLEALIERAQGKKDRALDLLRQAARSEESLPFAFGPPLVDAPSHELLGEMLLEAGQPAEASTAFEAALARAPQRTSALLGLARAAAKSGDTALAEKTYASLRQIWRQAEKVPDEVALPGSAGVPAGSD
jgi:tetratricopeptide (TPR) repeat protein